MELTMPTGVAREDPLNRCKTELQHVADIFRSCELYSFIPLLMANKSAEAVMYSKCGTLPNC